MKLHNRCLSNSIIFLLAILSSTSQAFTASTNLTDEFTLLTFKSVLSDPYNALSSWGNTTLHFCQWLGVTCGRKHPDRVTSLVLDSLDLSGNLSPHIANLTFLTNLRLTNCIFSGSIPNELGRLSRLTHLNLSFNYFDGEIPANLTHCTNLLTFDLLDNELSGVIPKDIGSLSQLKILNLGGNNLTGSIPSSFGNLSSLLGVLLQENHLTGGIPSIGKLSDLQLLQFESNNLSGNLPTSIYNLSSLRVMSMGSNSLTGTLPPSMFTTLPELQTLLLNTNQLEGHFPFSLSNATNMEDLEITENSFTGTIPSMGTSSYFYWINLSENLFETKDPSDWDFLTSLTNCSYLVAFGIESNNLGGTIPLSLGNLSTNLQTLLMGSNQITGSIPDVIGNLGNLTLLSLDDNLLTGSIPDTIGRLQKLHVLSLIGNRLTGGIPYTIGNVTQLNRLYLNGNSLNGVIPESLGNCQNLEELNISQNYLTGSIPKQLLMLSSLSTYLDLSYNLITGRLPVEVGQLTNLNALNISYNKLSGELPETLGKCQSLEYLQMQHNFFNGAIPKSFSELKGLRLMDLSQNNLSGQIPEYMGRLKGLQYLNLSYNNLEGEVPDEGVLGITTATVSVLGNKNLCGGGPNLHLPACHTQHLKKQYGSFVLKVVIPVLGLGSCLILAVVIIVTRRMKNQLSKSSSTNLMEGQFRQVSYAELLKATDGFSQSNLIGTGSVGTVYKGILDSDENVVAVKVLNLQQRGASKSFMAECEVLRRSRHRNLVKILTLCSSTDFSGNDFKALVLEFMPNGSLEKWLHPVLSEHSELMTLTLNERIDIAIDVASALEYLHHHGETPIVHCDLKPSNILLDSTMGAHVGDFGLAKLIWDDFPGADEHQTVSIGLKGTIGYVAPEYGMGGQVSTYGDVYSYGILLLELFTGKAPTDELFMDALNLHKYVGMAFPGGVMDILDLRLHFLENDQDSNDNNRIKMDATMPEYTCLVSVIEIGLACSNQDPRERMDMEDVTKALHTIRDSLLGFKRQG